MILQCSGTMALTVAEPVNTRSVAEGENTTGK